MTKPVGAVGSSFVYETPKGLNGPTGAVPELPVTAEMIAAGIVACRKVTRIVACREVTSFDWHDLAPVIYRAMAAKAPDRLPPVFMGTPDISGVFQPRSFVPCDPGYFVPCGIDPATPKPAVLDSRSLGKSSLLNEALARIAELEAELASPVVDLKECVSVDAASESLLMHWLDESAVVGSCERPSEERVVELIAIDPSLTERRLIAGIVAMRLYEEGDDAGEVASVWKAMREAEAGASQEPGNMFAGVKEFIADEKLVLECRALLAGKDQRIAELEAELLAAFEAGGSQAKWPEPDSIYNDPVWSGTAFELAQANPCSDHLMKQALQAALNQRDAARSRIAALEAALASLRSAFSDPAPADLPDPPRRPDGTLAPNPKP